MKQLAKNGETSHRIAQILNSLGFRSRNGSLWRGSTVHNILKRLDNDWTKPA